MATNTSIDLNAQVGEETVDLLGLMATFVREWRLGLICGVLVFLAGVSLTYMTTPLYEASATILPQQSRGDSNNLSALFSGKGPGDIFVGLLGSRAVADGVIDRADLLAIYKTRSRERARSRLGAVSKISSGLKDTLIKVTVRDINAQQASRIANAYVDSLQAVQEAMALSESTLQREFFEKQLQRERDELAKAELALKGQQESSGIVQAEAQTQLGLSAIAGKQAQITALQVQLAALLEGSTDQNPQVKVLRSEIGQLEAQQRRMEGAASGNVGASPGTGRMPEVNLEYARRYRDVKYHETLLNALSNQYQNARLIEASSETLFEVVDRAVVPEQKSWPPRMLFVLLSVAFGVVAGVGAIAVKLLGRRLRSDPRNQDHLRSMRRSLAGER